VAPAPAPVQAAPLPSRPRPRPGSSPSSFLGRYNTAARDLQLLTPESQISSAHYSEPELLPGTEEEKTNLEKKKRARIEEAGRRQGKKASAILSESKFI